MCTCMYVCVCVCVYAREALILKYSGCSSVESNKIAQMDQGSCLPAYLPTISLLCGKKLLTTNTRQYYTKSICLDGLSIKNW